MEEDDYDPDDLITVVVVPPDCVRFYAVKRISAKFDSRKLRGIETLHKAPPVQSRADLLERQVLVPSPRHRP